MQLSQLRHLNEKRVAKVIVLIATLFLGGCFEPENDAAFWETVDAFYYPDRNNLTMDLRQTGLKSVAECRTWVFQTAASKNDPNLARGDYECGVGLIEHYGPVGVYRITVR